MENVTTISQEELATITSLQEQYAEITAKLGQVHIEQLNLKIYQNNLEANYQALKEQENALGQEFNLFNFQDKWFKASVWGINMSIPIFDAGQKAQRIKQARLNLEKTSNTIENLQRAIDLQLSASSILFKNALLTLDVQDQNVALAEKVYNTTLKKYEQGLGSSFELLQTETELENAQSNYFQALYDAVTAKIAYTKALGKL